MKTRQANRYQRLPTALLRGVFVWVLITIGATCAADEGADDFFEKEVRPILVEKCVSCHGAQEQSGGLRVDSRQGLVDGGHTAAAVVPGDVAGSLIVRAVVRDGDLAMPPDEQLNSREIAALKRWIETGAAWPAYVEPLSESVQKTPENHWAFQPVRRPSVPVVDSEWVRTPIDAFVLAKLHTSGLVASPQADRRTLIRRVTYALTGLPPAPADVERFVKNRSEDAYEELVERLLASEQYGEHWARHWLDVARYADTKGYVYAREERHWVHAWTYRDWVVRALNSDLPYDRFLLLQLAADQVGDRDDDLAAMGFLTLGRRFLGVRRDIIDDRIDVVCRGMLGLTVSCARCHDHKYDPIPSADYYSLYGVFDSCTEQLVPLKTSYDSAEFEQELLARQQKLQDTLESRRTESSERVRERVADYLFAQSELHKYPANGFDQIFQKDDMLPAFVRQWERHLRAARRGGNTIFRAWHAYSDLPAESFGEASPKVTRQLQSLSSDQLNPIVARAFAQPPMSFREVCDRYGKIFADVKQAWETACSASKDADAKIPNCLPDPHSEALRLVLYGPQAPCSVPPGPIVHSETYFDSASCTELWKLQGEVDRWIINSQVDAPHALTLVDKAIPTEPRIFRRGNPLTKGKDVPRQFLAVLAGENRRPFQQGSGRYELAQAIIHPDNPLTARVMVNRIWAKYFGQGLVTTPSDFGTRAAPPSHPELLDWLASKLMEESWSLKRLHRRIVMSSTFCQTSGLPSAGAQRAAMEIDPNNRLLWRMNARRQTFEEFRDSLLAASSSLEIAVGGKPSDLFEPPFTQRRTLYGTVDRQYLPGTLRLFDFANPDLHVPKRNETTVPQQALFFMNHPLVLEAARGLAAQVESSSNPRKKIIAMFRSALQRRPTEPEIADALALIDSVASETNPVLERSSAVADWKYGYGALEEELGRTTNFRALPHFTGQAWQGGAKWPDDKLGWVQLTAEGGHPGNDRSHAAIRRWSAPETMTITIRSKLVHQPTQGDGIRAFIVSSRRGILQSATVHHDTQELHVHEIEVAQGETIDFIVDIGEVLNSDQYGWNVTIEKVEGQGNPITWDSVQNFTPDSVSPLNAWEQFAQVMLCTNEFMFID